MRISWGWFTLGCLGVAWQTLAPLASGFGHGWEMLNIARSLAATGSFKDPFDALATGPTAMEPPVFPFLISLLIRMFGDGIGLMWSAVVVCILGHGLYVALLPAAAERLTGDRNTGIAAALLAAILPAFPLMPQWDTILVSAGFLAYLILAQPGFTLRRSFGLGALAGLLSLFNPVTTLATLLRALFLVPRRRAALALLAVWGAGYLAVTGPWMVRNKNVVGSWTIRTGFGTTLYSANNDCAPPDLPTAVSPSGCYERVHPNKSAAEAGLVISLGEAEYDQLRTRDSLRWMATHVTKTMRLMAVRFWQFWFPVAKDQSAYAQAVWLLTVLSVPGFIAMARNRLPGWKYMFAVSVLAPIPYYLVLSGIRYRAPMLWAAQIAAGYFLALVISKLRSAKAQVPAASLSSTARLEDAAKIAPYF